jgi:hypothetical protein
MTAMRANAYAALVAIVASPAFAQSTRKSQTQRGSQGTRARNDSPIPIPMFSSR